jgi:hypothetical protein
MRRNPRDFQGEDTGIADECREIPSWEYLDFMLTCITIYGNRTRESSYLVEIR